MNGDQLELFRKLTAGIKFDVKRFRKDFEALGIIKPKPADNAEEKKVSPKSGGKRKREELDKENGKRRRKKKKKKEAAQMVEEVDELSDEEVEEAAESIVEPDEDSLSGLPEEEEEDEGKDPNWKNLSRNQKKKIKRKKKKKQSELLAQLHTEEMNHVRNQHKIHVYGTDLPDPVTCFEQLQTEYGLHEQIVENVKQWNFKEPTPIQMQAIPIMMQRRNIMACAPTGSGKTAAFILPILQHLKDPRNCGIRALVLAPTRELAKQIFREFHKFAEGRGFRIKYVNKASSSSSELKKCDVLVTTPNKLVFMLKQDPPQVDLTSVEWMIVDESDKLFEDGKSGFRDQLAEIYKACDSTSVRRGMFSATFAEDVQEWCRLNLDDVAQVYIGTRNTATSTVEQKLVFTGEENGKLFEIRQMVLKGLLQPPVLIFVQSKERAKQLYFELFHFDIKVDVIHSDRTPLQRDNVVRAFREGKIWVLICTELMGRGIDFKGVNLVINYDFPTSAISYIHRIGRTGRAGQPGQAITFFTVADQPLLRSIANVMREAGCEVPDFLLQQGKPNKNIRKKLARQEMKRPPISHAYKRDRAQRKRKRQLKAKIFKKGDGKSKKTDSKDSGKS